MADSDYSIPLEFRKALDKAHEENNEIIVLDVLNAIKSEELDVTEALLKITLIGKSVNNVAKSTKNKIIKSLATSIVASWKEQIAKSKALKEIVLSETETRKSSRPSKPVKPLGTFTSSSDDSEAHERKGVSSGPTIEVYEDRQAIPTKNASGELVFPDFPTFRPNLTPKEVLQLGSFGGTYFRPIKSSVTSLSYKEVWRELPADWLVGLDIKKMVSSSVYDTSKNTYGVDCGGDLHMWESSGWITEVDPYGWFQWYCRFYQGRRCSDDSRQISRGLGVIGAKGRWRNNLINKCISSAGTLEKKLE